MVDTYKDEALQNIHDEMYQGRSSEPPKGLSSLDKNTRTIGAIFIGAIIFFTYIGKLTLQQGLVSAAIGALVLYIMMSGQPKKTELTWLECMIRINDLLSFLQKRPIGGYEQIPKGQIKVTPIGRKQWYEGQSFKRSFGVDIWSEEYGTDEHYFVEIDIFTGDIITFRHAPEGVTGSETKDIKMIVTPETLMRRREHEFLNTGKK